MRAVQLELDAVKALPVAQRREVLLSHGEDQWFERKSIRIADADLAKTFVGMANAEGGLVAIGLSEGAVEDAGAHARKVNQIRRVPHTHCSPPPRVRFTDLILDADATVLLAEVSPGQSVHETTKGECYLRVGDSTLKLTAAQHEELLYDRGAAQFEARPANVAMSDLDSTLVDGLRAAMGAHGEAERTLAARSLIDQHHGVNIAGYLLLAPRPQEQFPEAQVRVLKYLEASTGSGSRQSLAADGDLRFEGPIPHVIHDASEAIDRLMPRRRALRADGRFGPVDLVPRDAWLEGLVNAVVHRSYSMAGDHIRVHLFTDHIEIESPGRFPGIVDPDQPLAITRYARNPRIARVCNDLGITQEKGEGIMRIFDEMRMRGLSDPIYRQTAGSVRLILRGTPRLSPETEAQLPRNSHAVLEALRAAGRPLGTGEVIALVGRQRPAVLSALKALEGVGEVVWRGNSPKDPRATWSLPHGH